MTKDQRVTLTSPLWSPAIRGGMIGFCVCAVAVGCLYPPALALAVLPVGWYALARLLDLPLFDADAA